MTKKQFFFILVSIGFLFSCKKEENYIGVAGNSKGNNVYFVDTFSVSLSTVLYNSLVTSQSSTMLSGHWDNSHTGPVTATSYIQLSLAGNDTNGDGIEDILSYTNTPVYDSLVLVMNRSYTYGDTVSNHVLSVHKLNQYINYVNGTSYLYNSSSFTYEATPLASKAVRFNSTESELRIKLSDAFGSEIFNKAVARDFHMANSSNFKDYFKGIALVPDASDKSIYGYSLGTVTMRLYYHDSGDPSTALNYNFSYNSATDLRFHQITNDRSLTTLKNLQEIYQELPSSQTNNESYLLTGIQLFPKINFPYLMNLKNVASFYTIASAQLIIHPKVDTYDDQFYLPDSLILYTTNQTNVPSSLIYYTGSSSPEIIAPIIDLESNEQTGYTFEITDFIVKKLSENNLNSSLLLAPFSSTAATRAERLILKDNSDQQYHVQLKIYIVALK